jgi:hypothetical protein
VAALPAEPEVHCQIYQPHSDSIAKLPASVKTLLFSARFPEDAEHVEDLVQPGLDPSPQQQVEIPAAAGPHHGLPQKSGRPACSVDRPMSFMLDSA